MTNKGVGNLLMIYGAITTGVGIANFYEDYNEACKEYKARVILGEKHPMIKTWSKGALLCGFDLITGATGLLMGLAGTTLHIAQLGETPTDSISK